MGYLIEPAATGPATSWEGHHATNPSAIRLSADPRVFLGYRAGGSADRFCNNGVTVWRSHLGLAVLDSRGDSVLHRFPLPIFDLRTGIALPQTVEQFAAYQAGPHRDRVVVLHDFRFWEDQGWLYVIYHEGSVTNVWDCVVRMPVKDFLTRVAHSVRLTGAGQPGAFAGGAAFEASWSAIWWEEGVWQPCGVDGTNRIYPSEMTKNDIVYLRLDDGSLMMYHRPVPDIALVRTAGGPFPGTTADGITEVGTLQSCIRPGYRDNSHIGNNSVPVPVQVGNTRVAMDVVHGVFNQALVDPTVRQKWKLEYYPYLRLLDTRTGQCLYYSRDPMLEYDGVWDEHARHGTWISELAHLDGVMFAGGQVAVDAGRTGLDDLFRLYTGVGDTAVATADFRLRELIPEPVVADIQSMEQHRRHPVAAIPENRYPLPERCSGWSWSIGNDPDSRSLTIRRELDGGEHAKRLITPRPGFFDADALLFDGFSVASYPDLGWMVQYRGARWDDAPRRTTYGSGILLLDRENPERVLYRSEVPLQGSERHEDGWQFFHDAVAVRMCAVLVPNAVACEVRRTYERRPLPSDMTRWLLRKAELPAPAPAS